ncbi:cell wall hydrolase [Niallia endozanthoxylica]|uniref:Cell wall hydrolase n=1 Tax=Niallia endozanthoxylica TaxID=2036016 RepID=A0A5J5HNU8_9BACI|nr:cell wall hydrolase [Niallia endozanthoxylica]KAA9021663.1 cell wall hydrolase [Niallia endozanthoxylica]
MKKIFILTALFAMLPLFLFPNNKIFAKTLESVKIYKAETGDSFHEIGMENGVSELELQKINDQTYVESGEKLIIPESTITNEEKELLARLVTAEAKGEPYEGKVEVAAVVLNRVEHEQYPDTIEEVIYQQRQFEPVENGTINQPATPEATQAVNEALVEQGKENSQSLNFYNPDIVESKWHESKTVTAVIGNHVFTK